jgi:acyl-CoA synthetase (AMP-forming)/AMP-acid ligase II
MRLIDKFDAVVDLHGSRPFIKDGSLTRTYEEAHGRINAIGRSIRKQLKRGSRIALWSSNSADAIECVYGIMRANCVFVPLNARNSVDDNIEILERYEVNGLFIEARFLAQCTDLCSRVATLGFVVVLGAEGDPAHGQNCWMDSDLSDLPAEDYSRDDLWAIYSTSGTTGRPKGVCHSHMNASVFTNDVLSCLGYRQAMSHLVVTPITHMAGVMTFSLTALGSTHVLCPTPKPSDIVSLLRREKIGVVFLPPTLIYLLLSNPENPALDFSDLRHIVSAGAPLSLSKASELIERAGPKLVNIYSQAEILGPITCLRPEDYLLADGVVDEQRLLSVGLASNPRIVAIMDDDGAIVPKGRPGEVVVKSFTNMDRFLGDAPTDRTNALKWHHTGDIGWMSEDGFLTLVDRKRDMIISGGFNVFSVEVEGALLSHPDVNEAAVIGIPDDKWGEAVTAIVELKEGTTSTEVALIAHCKARIGSVKSPKKVWFCDQLPRNNNGKVLKNVIREQIGEFLKTDGIVSFAARPA